MQRGTSTEHGKLPLKQGRHPIQKLEIKNAFRQLYFINAFHNFHSVFRSRGLKMGLDIIFFYDWSRFKKCMGLCELRHHTQSSGIPELEGAQPRKQVGYNRFWKRETQRAGKCRLSLGVEGVGEPTDTEIVWRKGGTMLCYDATTEREKCGKITWMNGTYVFVPLLFYSKRKTFLRSGRLYFMLLFSISGGGNGGLLFQIIIFLKFSLLFKERDS